MKRILWTTAYFLAFILAVIGTGYLGLRNSMASILAPPPEHSEAIVPLPTHTHSATKATVAVLLVNTATESTDFLGPYAMFAESGDYNVYAVAASRDVRALSGGLGVVPDLSFTELGDRLPAGPDVVVVPAIVNIKAPENRTVLNWLREQGRRRVVLFSWCEGAEVLAASGLIDGRTVTTHWASLDQYERAYPAVSWKRAVRYVDNGDLITTAGLTSGIDATRHFLETRKGRPIAEKVARALDLPSSPFVSEPRMGQYSMEASDSVFLLNLGFGWPRPKLGIRLDDGVDELAMAALLDVYQATDRIYTVAHKPFVVSRHGLQLVPRWTEQTLPKLARTLSPAAGGQAFRTALEDLARNHDVASARFAAKRLEVRDPLNLVGRRWPIRQTIVVVFSGLVGFVVLRVFRWVLRRCLCTKSPV